MLDVFDLLALAGVILVLVAVGLAWGWIAVLGFVGVVLVTVGIGGAFFTEGKRNAK